MNMISATFDQLPEALQADVIANAFKAPAVASLYQDAIAAHMRKSIRAAAKPKPDAETLTKPAQEYLAALWEGTCSAKLLAGRAWVPESTARTALNVLVERGAASKEKDHCGTVVYTAISETVTDRTKLTNETGRKLTNRTHAAQARVLQYIIANPGCYSGAILAAFNMPKSNLRRTADALQNCGKIVIVMAKSERNEVRQYFPLGGKQ